MNCPHCDTEISVHPASRCLDAWVAETVMELEIRITKDAIGEFLPLMPGRGISLHEGYYAGSGGKLEELVPTYSKVVYSSWMVLKKIKSQDMKIQYRFIDILYGIMQRNNRLPIGALMLLLLYVEPVDICLAAIKAVSDDGV